MASRQTLSPKEEAEARTLYEEFWARYPNIKNPTDINKPEKEEFFRSKRVEDIALMQRARKQGYPFTRPDEDDTDE